MKSYLDVEKKYCTAATLFFNFHHCDKVRIANLEKPSHFNYTFLEAKELREVFNTVEEGAVLSVENVNRIVQLILREVLWAELHCANNDKRAVRFGYDFYMYFNSEENMDELFGKIIDLGLFVD